MAEKKLKFEEAMAALEQVVADMEAGNVTLDESLALYEKGMKLVRQCTAALDAADRRVEAVRLTSDGAGTVPFDDKGDENK